MSKEYASIINYTKMNYFQNVLFFCYAKIYFWPCSRYTYIEGSKNVIPKRTKIEY